MDPVEQMNGLNTSTATSPMTIRTLLHMYHASFLRSFPILLLPVELRLWLYRFLDPSSLENISKTCTQIQRETEDICYETLRYYFHWDRHFFRPYCIGHGTMRVDVPTAASLNTFRRENYYGNTTGLMDLDRCKKVQHLRFGDSSFRSACLCAEHDACDHRINNSWLRVLFPRIKSISVQGKVYKLAEGDPGNNLELQVLQNVCSEIECKASKIVPLLSADLSKIYDHFANIRTIHHAAEISRSGNTASMLGALHAVHLAAIFAQKSRNELLEVMKCEAAKTRLCREVSRFCAGLAASHSRWPHRMWSAADLPEAEGIVACINNLRAYITETDDIKVGDLNET